MGAVNVTAWPSLQAMVTTPSAQAHDFDKRKKHTLEKAKVIHLTRQLQLRLQYARLKVDHGWQRQNLNEVENLYFHHSHIRTPKPRPVQSVSLTAAAAAAAKRMHPELELRNISSTAPNSSQGGSSDAVEAPSDDKTADPRPPMQYSDNLMDVDATNKSTSGGFSAPGATSSPSHHPQSNLHNALMQVLSSSEKSSSSPLQSRTSSSGAHLTSSAPFSSNTSSPNRTTNSRLLSSTSSTALTYDSFWSNHNTSKPFRSSFLNLLTSTDLETNKATAQALLSGLSGKSISSLTSDLTIPSSSPASDTTSSLTPMARRNVPAAAVISDGSKDG